MANPWSGEVALWVDGERRVLKLTLGALAELEAGLPSGGIPDLVERCETGNASVSDIWALIVAGLRGGGWQGSAQDLLSAEIDGGLPEASRVAALLLVRAFTMPQAQP